jgi:hypothetical protein
MSSGPDESPAAHAAEAEAVRQVAAVERELGVRPERRTMAELMEAWAARGELVAPTCPVCGVEMVSVNGRWQVQCGPEEHAVATLRSAQVPSDPLELPARVGCDADAIHDFLKGMRSAAATPSAPVIGAGAPKQLSPGHRLPDYDERYP